MSSMSIPLKATRSFSAASMNAINDVRSSKELTKKKVVNNSRPTDLPDAESLYDELQIVRKEIATQQKVIKTQRTKNVRLEAELKKRESQLADIFDGNERKSKNDQLQARIMHLEFELREKNEELAKVKFDQQTNSINELKKANEIYATELDRLKKIIFDRQEVNKAKVQEERKQQISQLKNALTKIGRERETLKLENEKFSSQLENLKSSQLDDKLKSRKELDHLRTELRKARVTQSKAEISKPQEANQSSDSIKSENEHLRRKIEKMALEAKDYENVKHDSGHAIDKLENTISDLEISLKESKSNETSAEKTIELLRQELASSKQTITTLETRLEGMIEAPKSEPISRRTSVASEKPPGVVEADIIGALTGHIYRTDLTA